MTNVYGVTFVGGREQILRQLKVGLVGLYACNLSRNHTHHHDYPNFKIDPKQAAKVVKRDYLFDAAQYLTACVFQSLGEMFTSAQAIQVGGRCPAHLRAPRRFLTLLHTPLVLSTGCRRLRD